MSKQSLSEWLCSTEKLLHERGIETARLDSLVLLSDEIGRDKSWLLAHPEYTLQGSECENLSTKIAQRAKHIPLAYIRGKTEFYGREFAVNEHVLVPRPESEAMIDLLKRLSVIDDRFSIFDIGTGTGCLAITAKLELPECKVIATDIDPKCLSLAKNNAQTLGADITFLEGDLLASIQNSRFEIQDSIFLANLPYVPESYPINKAAAHEPKLALFSGTDGLEHFRRFFKQVQELPRQPRHIITESLSEQHKALARIAEAAGYRLDTTQELAQLYASL